MRHTQCWCLEWQTGASGTTGIPTGGKCLGAALYGLLGDEGGQAAHSGMCRQGG